MKLTCIYSSSSKQARKPLGESLFQTQAYEPLRSSSRRLGTNSSSQSRWFFILQGEIKTYTFRIFLRRLGCLAVANQMKNQPPSQGGSIIGISSISALVRISMVPFHRCNCVLVTGPMAATIPQRSRNRVTLCGRSWKINTGQCHSFRDDSHRFGRPRD